MEPSIGFDPGDTKKGTGSDLRPIGQIRQKSGKKKGDEQDTEASTHYTTAQDLGIFAQDAMAMSGFVLRRLRSSSKPIRNHDFA